MTGIKRIILVAAPSCCGKSTFIDSLVDNGIEEIAQGLRMGNPADWTYVDAYYFGKNTLAQLAGMGASNVVIHWTIPRRSLKVTLRNVFLLNAYDKKERIAVLHAAREVSVVTLFNSSENLLRNLQFRTKRIRELREQKHDSFLLYFEKILNIRSLKKLYSKRENLIPMYEKWFGFCETLHARERFLIDLSASHANLTPQSGWAKIKADWQAGD